MKVIGITGSIATGKSSVTKYLIDKGYMVIDSDLLAYNALTIDENCINQVKELFDCVENNQIDRRKLGKIIFNDKKAKKQLEEIVHPYVIKEIKSKLKEYQKEALVFLDIPLLYESHLEYLCDKIVVVYCNINLQLQRLIKRDNIDRDYAKKIIKNQISVEDKKQLADIVLDNNSNLNDLYKQIDDMLKGE